MLIFWPFLEILFMQDDSMSPPISFLSIGNATILRFISSLIYLCSLMTLILLSIAKRNYPFSLSLLRSPLIFDLLGSLVENFFLIFLISHLIFRIQIDDLYSTQVFQYFQSWQFPWKFQNIFWTKRQIDAYQQTLIIFQTVK